MTVSTRSDDATPGGPRSIFGYMLAAEGLTSWPCLGQKILKYIRTLFRTTPSILFLCMLFTQDDNSEFTPQEGKKEEDRETLVCDKRERAITCMFRRDLYLTSLFSGLLQKDLFKGGWSLAESFFKQNYCHVCHTRFAGLGRTKCTPSCFKILAWQVQ